MTKILFKTGLFSITLLCVVGFTPKASAISVSIGDPVEVLNLWTNIRAEVNDTYNELGKYHTTYESYEENEWQEVRNYYLDLIERMEALGEEFAKILRFKGGENTITVVYPNGGETFECGKSYNIIWDTEIADKQMQFDELLNPTFGIYLSANDEFGGRYIVRTIVNNLITEDEEYDWLVPCDIRSDSYFTRIIVNPELQKKMILPLEDSSDASFGIISTTPDAIINSLSIDKASVGSGENINISWSGSDVSEYKLYFGTEFGTGASMNGEFVGAQSVSMGTQTSASFSYTNTTDTPKKVFVMLEAYGTREFRDSSNQVEITINPIENF